MMKVLLIGKLRTDVNSLWKFVKDNEGAIKNKYPNATINNVKASIPINQDILLILIPENNEAVVKEAIERTLPSNFELFICSHELPTSDIKTKFLLIPSSDINTNFLLIPFKHEEKNEPYKQIARLIDKLPVDKNEAEKEFNVLCEYIKKNSSKNLKSRLLSLFLPLDIDMQVLEMICNDEKLSEDNKIKKIRDYLTDNETGMLKDATVNYHKKLEEAQEEVNTVEELKNNDTLKKLLCIDNTNSDISGFLKFLDTLKKLLCNDDTNSDISGFLKFLDKKKEVVKNPNSISDKDIQGIIQYFGKGGGWKIEGAKPELIISFHDWYCALAECLRDEEGKG